MVDFSSHNKFRKKGRMQSVWQQCIHTHTHIWVWYVCVWMCGCTGIQVLCGGLRLVWGIFLILPVYSLRQGLSIKPRACWYGSSHPHLALGTVSKFWGWDDKGAIYPPSIYVDSGDPNSCPFACTTSILRDEPTHCYPGTHPGFELTHPKIHMHDLLEYIVCNHSQSISMAWSNSRISERNIRGGQYWWYTRSQRPWTWPT